MSLLVACKNNNFTLLLLDMTCDKCITFFILILFSLL